MARLKQIPGRSWAVGVTICVMAGLSVIAFIESFYAMSNLTVLLGGAANMAWGFPTFIDGAMVAAMISIFVLRGQKGVRMARMLFIGSAAASIFGNVAHTVLVFDPSKGGLLWLAITWFVLPPVFLLILTEVLVLMTARRPAGQAEIEGAVAPAVTVGVPEPAASSPEEPVADAVETVITTDTVPGESDLGVEALQEAVTASDASGDTDAGTDTASDSADNVVDADRATDPVPAEPQPESIEAPVAHAPAVRVDEVQTFVEQPAPVRTLHAVEQVPETPDEQVAWILKKAHAGVDVSSWKDVARMFDEQLGLDLSMRTVQRRLALAKQRDPEAFGLAS